MSIDHSTFYPHTLNSYINKHESTKILRKDFKL